MKKLPIIVFLLTTSIVSFAQKTINLSGIILDKNQAIEFVNVTISKTGDTTKVLQFAVSDSVGKFHFQLHEQGEFVLKASLIGYLTYKQIIKIGNSDLDLGNIELKTDNKLLGEVVVTAQKKLIEKTNEGFVVNAAANITQLGGTATDLLKSTPTIAVDADGAITLRGKTPLILINGRNSKLANADQIPASSIESIEVINNASAKYDANAQSGIINIILKKNAQNGTNGAIALGVGEGSRGRISSSALLNHRADKWNIGLAYDNRFAGRTKHITTNRTNFLLPETYQINQDRHDERVERLQNLKLNLDFQPNEKNTFSFEAIGNVQGQDNDEKLNSIILKQNMGFSNANDRHSLEYRRSKVGEFALNYNRKFADPKKSLSASATTSIEQGRENTDIDTQQLAENATKIGNVFYQKTHNYEDDVISNIIVDYATPIGAKGVFETGYKGTFRSVKNDYEASDKRENVFVVNQVSSNIFNFSEQINAVYALYHNQLGSEKWKYELGVRAEQVSNSGKTQDNSTKFTNEYLKLFPTANLIYDVSEGQSWKLSYGKRINRPSLGDFNPFVDITDALNPHSGNPNLKPEIVHAAELGYNKEWEKATITSNIFYRHSTNTIRQFLQPLGNGVVLRLPVNIGTADSYGLESVITAKPSRVYDFNASFTLFEQLFGGNNASAVAQQNTFNWFGKLINNITVGKNGKLQIIGNYTSAATTPQGNLIPIYYADLGYQQKLGKGNARLGLLVVDIFNTLNSGGKTLTTEFITNRTQKADTRAFMLTFAYSFKSGFKEKLMENKFSKEF
ncbi:TonB-dependent receptor (plasmid) [Emticicia oligotrophica DSM 17448]|uniref:TonB-dependent receptor n=1 Tax=Emticicia oligotrophica (strain DSM 17448 / CIP 109782 / MTCC 6937 / GPTSA100-15) TaxID=929562 RepID=A0ABN4ASF7_EMTOG|nr:TonB-dependent receptor [Emticicia oligotrophica]AFK05565.1 TonB-dependent receptor [Emticicia oligotrophica DSM 17448]